MRRTNLKKYLIFGGLIFGLTVLPPLFVESLRGKVIALFSPFWRSSDKSRRVMTGKKSKEEIRIAQLESENQVLRNALKKSGELNEKEMVSARVVYRNPASWGASLWINVGKKTNQLIKKEIIAKNSPVLLGKSLIGIVDYVGNHQSRVRLITSRELQPSVRALRGGLQKKDLLVHLEAILRCDLHLSQEEKALLKKMHANLSRDEEGIFLAKGYLQGRSAPLWRSDGLFGSGKLAGIGFNYDFSDEKGPARDLRSGKPKDEAVKLAAVPLLKIGDLLVTTGMDGIFPPDLFVAEVTKIYPLREGAVTYEIEAVPAAGSLDEIDTVFIVAPLNLDYAEILDELI